jgi:hypothetical protein
MQKYKPAFDLNSCTQGMAHYINRYEKNQNDWALREWTRSALFHYLVEYYDYKNIEEEQIKKVYNENGCRIYNHSNYKFIVSLSIRIFENQSNFDLDSEFLKVYEKTFLVMLNSEITSKELNKIALSAS